MILTIRTDKPEAELALYEGHDFIDGQKWLAHKELSITILSKIDELLSSNQQKQPTGIVVFAGPGSFTGLRIGFTVAKTLAYSFDTPIVKSSGEDWTSKGIEMLLKGDSDPSILPDYGGEANITEPKK